MIDISNWNRIQQIPNKTTVSDSQLSILAQQVAILSWYKYGVSPNYFSFAGACAIYEDALFDYDHPQRGEFIKMVRRAGENESLQKIASQKSDEALQKSIKQDQEDNTWLIQYIEKQNSVEAKF